MSSINQRYFPTSIADSLLGISSVYLKNLRETHGGFLKGGEHYILGASQTASIRWDVEKIAQAMHLRGEQFRKAQKVLAELQGN